MKQVVQVFNRKSGEVVKEIDVTDRGWGYIEKLETGLLRKMDIDNWGVRVVKQSSDDRSKDG